MTEVKNLRKIEDFSRKLHEKKDPTHDFSHIKRVIKLCRKLAVSEKCDINLLLVSAYFHGVLNKETEIRKFLKSVGYSDSFIDKVIITVRNSTSGAGTIEEKILHDANLLDVLGAIGIARSFTKGEYEKQTLNETLKILEKI